MRYELLSNTMLTESLRLFLFNDPEVAYSTTTHSNILTKSKKLMEVAGREVSNRYTFAAVTNMLKAVQRPDAEQDLYNTGGQYLTRQDVKNTGRHWKETNPDPRVVGRSFLVKEQQMELMEWLEQQPGRVNPY